MSFFDPQNPGIGGLDELTPAEEVFLTSLAGLSYSNGDILYYNSGSIRRLGIGSSGNVLTVSGGLPTWGSGGGGGSVSFGTDNQIPFVNAAGTDFDYSSNLLFDGSIATLTANALGITQVNTKGLLLTNTTAAAVGAQQISPAIAWHGSGWKTVSTAASQTIDFRAYVLTQQGSTVANGVWKLESSIAGASYVQRFAVEATGDGSIGRDLLVGRGIGNSANGYGADAQVLTSGGAGANFRWTTLSDLAFTGIASGSGTTTNGTGVDLGGELMGNVVIGISDNLFGFQIAHNSNRYLDINKAENSYSIGDIDDAQFFVRINGSLGLIYLKDTSLGIASNGFLWTLTDASTGEGQWLSGGVTDSFLTGDLRTVTVVNGLIVDIG